MTGAINLRFEKQHAQQLKKLGYQRHPQGSGWVRPLKKAWFPRFHLHTATDWQAKLIRLDLHLDHTRENPDSRAPTAASDSGEVAAELQRILRAFPEPGSQTTAAGPAMEWAPARPVAGQNPPAPRARSRRRLRRGA